MTRIVKRPRARADLIDAWLYSMEQWGETGADDYLAALEHALNVIANYPMIGVSCDEIERGLRRFVVRSHIIYYLHQRDTIEIVRVLNERMNADDQFDVE